MRNKNLNLGQSVALNTIKGMTMGLRPDTFNRRNYLREFPVEMSNRQKDRYLSQLIKLGKIERLANGKYKVVK